MVTNGDGEDCDDDSHVDEYGDDDDDEYDGDFLLRMTAATSSEV